MRGRIIASASLPARASSHNVPASNGFDDLTQSPDTPCGFLDSLLGEEPVTVAATGQTIRQADGPYLFGILNGSSVFILPGHRMSKNCS